MNRLTSIATLAALSLLPLCGCETAPQTAGEKASLASDSKAALESFYYADPTLKALVAKTAGYAIFPSVGKAGFIIGGSYGRGEVFELGKKVGYSDITQATFGLQAGAQTYSELILFMRKADVISFKGGDYSLNANVSAVAIKPGVAGTTDSSKGVIIFTKTNGGLMAEASVGGQAFHFSPL
jgi:hypothetical protein